MRTGGAPAAASVVIPAHNEAGVIEECLRALLRDARPGELEVVVACNGCTDDTAARARSFGTSVTVVSTRRPGKAEALNLADAACHTFPRVYVDADVLLETPALRRLVAALEPQGTALAASPRLGLDLTRSSAAVRSFYRLWSRLPSVRDDLVGRGVYALSERGHARVTPFPEITADDHHVRSAVPRPDRVVVDECSSLVRPPRTLRSLVRRRARVVAGNRELGASGPGAGGVLAVLRDDPRRAVDAPVFVLVAVLARLAAARRRPGQPIPWGRDDSRPTPVAE
jgi:glycosyltransferase involved in cell wall biosynthesis